MLFFLRPTRQNHIKHSVPEIISEFIKYIMRGILAFLARE